MEQIGALVYEFKPQAGQRASWYRAKRLDLHSICGDFKSLMDRHGEIYLSYK